MAPITPGPASSLASSRTPRVIVYHQSHYRPDGSLVSALPLLTERSGVTHVILAAVHLNERPGDVTLNDDDWRSPRAAAVWAEARALQAGGVAVLAMLGGAAKGSYTRLDGDAASFEAFYGPLRDLLASTGVDGVDLDVEEDMSLAGAVRLIDRLHADFGIAFTITLAPVAPALVGQRHLSGFDYFALDKAVGARHVAWYNVQFYCGWGSAESTAHYDAIIACGWSPQRVVLGLVTNPANGDGWIPHDMLAGTVARLRDDHPGFGGVMGWEYFNSLADPADGGAGAGKPWLWAKAMSTLLKNEVGPAAAADGEKAAPMADPDNDPNNPFLQIVRYQ